MTIEVIKKVWEFGKVYASVDDIVAFLKENAEVYRTMANNKEGKDAAYSKELKFAAALMDDVGKRINTLKSA